MTDYGYDAAFFQPAELVASGCVVVFVYTDGTHAYSAADVAKIHAVKPIVFNHENAQTELAGGYAAGALAAKHAVAAVLAYGAPADGSVSIVFSIDANIPVNGFAPYRAALDGINDYIAGRFKVSVYSEGALIDDLAVSGRINAKAFLSASSSYPGHNVNDAHVGAYQQVGSNIPSTDRDVITDLPGLAPWWPLGVSPSGGGTPINPTPPTPPEEDTMQPVAVHVSVLDASNNPISTYLVDPLWRWKYHVPDHPTEAVVQVGIKAGLYLEGGPVFQAMVDAIPDYPVSVELTAELESSTPPSFTFTGTIIPEVAAS